MSNGQPRTITDKGGQFPVQQTVQQPPTFETLVALDNAIEEPWFRAAFRAQIFLQCKRRRLATMTPRDLWEHPNGKWFAFNREVPTAIRDELIEYTWGSRPIFGEWLSARRCRLVMKETSQRAGIHPWIRWVQLASCDADTRKKFSDYLLERRKVRGSLESRQALDLTKPTTE